MPRGKAKARSANKNASKRARNKASTSAAVVDSAQPNSVNVGDPVNNDHQLHEKLHGQGHQGSLDEVLNADYCSRGEDGETTPTEPLSEDERDSGPQGEVSAAFGTHSNIQIANRPVEANPNLSDRR